MNLSDDKIKKIRNKLLNIERVKREIKILERYLKMSSKFQPFLFEKKEKKIKIKHKGEEWYEIELSKEQLQYLLGMKEQELRNLEKELDEL